MEKEKNVSTAELLKGRKWTKFLKSLPLYKLQTFKLKNCNDMFTLKVTASIQNKKDANRKYSLNGLDYTRKYVNIKVTPK